MSMSFKYLSQAVIEVDQPGLCDTLCGLCEVQGRRCSGGGGGDVLQPMFRWRRCVTARVVCNIGWAL